MLIIGVVFILLGTILAIYGNNMNNNLEYQLESIWNDGVPNPGDPVLFCGIAIAVLGLILLIAGICKYMSDNAYSRSGSYEMTRKWCSSCGFGLREGDAFCSRCGSKQLRSTGEKCVNCGQILQADATFCTKCGMKIGED